MPEIREYEAAEARVLEDDLGEWLGEPVPMGPDPEADGDDPRYVVNAPPDEDYADALLERAARLEREQARITAAAQRKIDKVTAWRDDRLGGVNGERGRIRQSLELFMRKFHRENPKRKTLPLSNGKLTLRAPGVGRLEVTDEYVFVAWAEANRRDDLLTYKPVPSKAALKDLPERHTRPQETIPNDHGEPELYNVWSILAEVGGEHGEVERVSIPGVRYVQRVEDRFDMKLPTDGTGETDDND